MSTGKQINTMCNNSSNDNDEQEKYKQIALLPYTYSIQQTRENIHKNLYLAMNHWLKVSDTNLKLVTDIIDLINTGNTIHFDIEDNCSTHNRLPAAHNIFGIPQCINAGTFVFTKALEVIVHNFPNNLIQSATKLLNDNFAQCLVGKGLDIFWRESGECPTEEQYFQMVECKTGSIFALGVKLMQLFSDWEEDFMPLIKQLSQYFQIREDYKKLNVENDKNEIDLTDNQTRIGFLFPIIHALFKKPRDHRIPSILKQRFINVETKKYLLKLLNEFDSMSYTREKCSLLSNECKYSFSKLDKNPLMEKLLEDLL